MRPKCVRPTRRQVQIDGNVRVERCLETGNQAAHGLKEMSQVSNPDGRSLAHLLVHILKTPVRSVQTAFFHWNSLAKAAADYRNREVVATTVSIDQELDLFSGNQRTEKSWILTIDIKRSLLPI